MPRRPKRRCSYPGCPDLTYKNGIEDETLPALQFVPVPGGPELDAKVLSLCYLKARKVSEIAGYFGISDSTYLRKRILGNLEKKGYLEKNKVSRTAYHKTIQDMVYVE